MIPVTYPSSVSTSKESQMVVFALSSVAGLQRWTDYIPVKYQSTGSDIPNSFNTNGYIACDFITSLTGKQAWVDYVPVFVDNAATTAWQVSDTGFIPFNTLAGGGTYVSLDLNFLNATALDSRITFSRGTNATLTDSNGRIAWAPHNLLTNSEDFEAAAWNKGAGVTVTANATIAPDLTTTADNVAFATGGAADFLRTAPTMTVGVVYTMSVYALLVSGTPTFRFDIGNGGGGASAAQTPTTTWQRFSFTFTFAGANSWIDLEASGPGTIAFWGAQLNVGSTAQSYNSTTPKNLLGFTQEPENAAWTKSNSYVQQNLLLQSQDFATTWVNSRTAVTVNTTAAPDGSITADTIAEDNQTGATGRSQTVSTVAGVSYTFSCFLKNIDRRYVQLMVYASATANYISAAFDLVAQTSTTAANGTGYSVTSASVVDVGNGWFRCSITGVVGTTPAVAAAISPRPDATAGGFPNYAGTTLAFYAWGAQLVQGSTAGDYTQTTSAAEPTRYLNWDGTLTGRKMVEDTVNTVHLVREPFTSTGVPYSLNVYAKAGERSFVLIRTLDPSFDKYTWFNLANGTVGTTASGHTASIQSVGNGWYRCNVTYTFIAGSCFVYAGVANADNVSAYTGDGTSGIYVSDFQLSNSASVDPYVYNPQAAAASAAYYGPRFDYDPVTLASRGLLIEEQRTNLFTNSDFNSGVSGTGLVTSSTMTGPTGATITAAAFGHDGTTTSFLYKNTVAATTQYAISVFVRMDDGNAPVFGSSTTTSPLNDFALVVSGGAVPVSTYTVENFGGGLYRVSGSVISQATNLGNNGVVKYSTNSNRTFKTSGWQVEAGSFATSYIPTVASQVTRNADSASMLGDNFYTWYNPNQGTLSVETGSTADSVYPTGAVLTDGTTSNNILIQGSSPATSQQFYIVSGGVAQVNLATQTFSSTLTKTAAAYKANDFAYSTQGAAVSTDVAGSVPTVSQLVIGAERTSNLFNGTIRRIGYYNTRLPDSTLQAMTT